MNDPMNPLKDGNIFATPHFEIFWLVKEQRFVVEASCMLMLERLDVCVWEFALHDCKMGALL